MGTDTTLSVALIIALIGVASTIYTLSINRKKNVQTEDAKMEEIRTSCLKANMKLDTVCGTLTDIKTDVKAVQQQAQVTQTELAVVQRDLKTAFNRIDELKARLGSETL